MNALLRIRDAIVAPLGIKTSRQFRTDRLTAPENRIALFKVMSRHEDEIVFGQDDVHLDFRSSVFIAPADAKYSRRRLIAVTVVRCHNLLGRTYIWLITPFHKLVVASALRRAEKKGWPSK